MNKLVCCVLAVGLFFSQSYYGSSTAPVVIAGGIIKAKHTESIQKKYKRKDCPVCKGKGWYISGDSIKKVDCGYCEPEQGDAEQTQCDNGSCNTKVIKK